MKNQKVYLISFVFIFFALPVFSQQENTEEEMYRLYEVAASKWKEYVNRETNGITLNIRYNKNLFSTNGLNTYKIMTTCDCDGNIVHTYTKRSLETIISHKFDISVLYQPVRFLGIRSSANFAFGQTEKGTKVIDQQNRHATLQQTLKSKQYAVDLAALFFVKRILYFGVGTNYTNTITTGTSTQTAVESIPSANTPLEPISSTAKIKPTSKWGFPIFMGLRFLVTTHLDLGVELGYQKGMYYGIHAGFPLSKKTLAARMNFVKKRKEYQEAYKQALEIDRVLHPEKFVNDNSSSDSGGGGGDGGDGGGGGGGGCGGGGS